MAIPRSPGVGIYSYLFESSQILELRLD